jgi:hypothetical protein
MPRSCSVCHHPERAAIDEALRNAESYRSIAQRFGMTKDSLLRHRRAHTVTRPAASPPDPLRAFLYPCPAHGDVPFHYTAGQWLCVRCSPWNGSLTYFRLPSARP